MASHFPSLSIRSHMGLNAHMFSEDVHLAVMPIGGTSAQHPDFRANLEGDDEAVSAAKQILSNFVRNRRPSLEQFLADVISKIAVSLAHEGRALYEMVLHENDDYSVRRFTSRRLVRLPCYYFQLIPRGDWDLWGRKFSLLRATRVWKVEMPRSLGGPGGYRRLLKRLRRFDGLAPDFWREDMGRGKQSEGLDLAEYSLNSDIYINRVTRAWGWNRRDWTQKRSTECFLFYKLARFRRSQAVLRRHIVNELNGLLSRLDIECKISITGLPAESEIETVLRQLANGDIGFDAVSDAVTI